MNRRKGGDWPRTELPGTLPEAWAVVRRPFRHVLAGLACALALGCATDRAQVDNQLMGDRHDPERAAGVSERYRVGCPDVLEIAVQGRPEFDGHYTVEPDGCIFLGRYGRLRVEGQELADIGRGLAEEIGVGADDVRVRVAGFRSQQVVLFGAVTGRQRTVAYQGQETVLDLLQRVGGITPGAAPAHVYVVRARLGQDRPEVFHVDLDAIVMDKDERTNVRILPYDQIYVGETRQARMERLVPPWLRPIYQAIWDLLPAATAPRDEESFLSKWIAGKK
jgi:polysaccharide biosynthesis/export protein